MSCLAVQQVNKEELLRAIEDNTELVVFFYDPGCQICTRFSPTFDKLAKDHPKQEFVKIIGTNYFELLKEYQIPHFPSIRLFTNGVEREYMGGYEYSGVSEFIQSNTGDLAKQVNNEEELPEFVSNCFNCVVYQGTQQIQDFELESKRFPNTKTAWFPSSESTVSLVYYRNSMEIDSLPSEELNSAKIRAFFSKNYKEEFLPFDKEGATAIFGKKRYGFVVYTKDPNHPIVEEFQNIASFLEGTSKFVFSVSDTESEIEREGAGLVGMDDRSLPVIALHDARQYIFRTYLYEGKPDFDRILNFIEDFKHLKLKQHFKSEEIPSYSKGPVHKVVSKNFKATVNRAEQDLIFYFYKDQCSHCKTLDPIYANLAAKADMNELRFLKIDEEKNAVEGIFIDRVPTIIYFKHKETENFERYDIKEYTEEALMSWIKSVTDREVFKKDEL